ncbi:APO protein 3 [Forsythia ovata]|uniref:APO protein 3 n=1 Tax=Forsythia ovata TaxID=205694 RepID=A0ABD1TBW8_9LAMI
MFPRRARVILHFNQIISKRCNAKNSATDEVKNYPCALYSTRLGYVELPRMLSKSDRKPWVTDINEVKRKARLEKKEKKVVREVTLNPPENGLLVQELIPVAHEVLAARSELFTCISRVADSIPVYYCSVCGEVHVGDPPHKIRTCNVSGSKKNKEHTWASGGIEHILPVVESFHLYDRLGRAVSHNERLQVDQIPAIVELCIQAGVDILEYPTRRREFPVYRVAGRIIDFEKRISKNDLSRKDIDTFGFWEMAKRSNDNGKSSIFPCKDLKGIAVRGMVAWEKMRSGAIELMQKYAVKTCGYCSEIQVGPKGHRVRQCQAFKHQMRDGQHAWQEANIDNLVPPVYVWHVHDSQDTILIDALKRYYGKLPAAVKLFSRAGAQVGAEYSATTWEDVVMPGLDEEKLVV